jgi:hypothetical protein
MWGLDQRSGELFSYVNLEKRAMATVACSVCLVERVHVRRTVGRIVNGGEIPDQRGGVKAGHGHELADLQGEKGQTPSVEAFHRHPHGQQQHETMKYLPADPNVLSVSRARVR